MAKKKARKATKKRATKRKTKGKTKGCKLVTICGKRRKVCRDRKGRITSNKKA